MSVGRVTSIDVGTTNMAVCVVEQLPMPSSSSTKDETMADLGVPRYPYSIVYWDLIDLRTQSTSEAVSNMTREFMSRPMLYDGVTDVAIESQEMSRPIMQRLNSALQAHFETWSIMNVQRSQGRAMRVHPSVNGSNKLKIFTGDMHAVKAQLALRAFKVMERLPTRKISASEARRLKNKCLSEIHVCGVLEQMQLAQPGAAEHYLTWLQKFKKCDDLADAFLQGCWVLLTSKAYESRAPAIALPYTN